MSAPAVPVTLTITVLDSATIFEGPDTVYRYDLPGTGIVDGWALPAVLDQARELCNLQWPEVEIVIDADESATEVLTHSFLNKGVAAYPTEALRETPLPGPREEELMVIRPSSDSGRHRLPGGVVVSPFHFVVAAVVLAIGGLSWWALDSGPIPVVAEPMSETSTTASPQRTTAPDTATSISTPSPQQVILEHSGLRLSAPGGFRLEDRDGGLMALGEDPGLRIHLSADPVYSVPAAAVLARVHEMVAEDGSLHALEPQSGSRGQELTRYREDPGDGSEVVWHTWVEAGHQFSVGCHSRAEATIPQEAACRMALDSLELRDY
ncbi:hypothetical protein CATRI_02265 [Corynebacterium atrinae]|uniref:type VII secretion-associated protein n=1 Tax=Corynebacterium atrinae TaxID=1336740 RepID=UPI0025B3E18F|nr:type VII secretion-associated protein [Corynebacterium atrinae]WJY62558.1 hypothetical protein CATRI_02265 [Corynebacterium atrinae]